MTKEDVVDIIENYGELVHKQGELYSAGYLIDDESMDKISEAILRRQDFNGFIEVLKKNLNQDIEAWKEESRYCYGHEFGHMEGYISGKISGLEEALKILDKHLAMIAEEKDENHR